MVNCFLLGSFFGSGQILRCLSAEEGVSYYYSMRKQWVVLGAINNSTKTSKYKSCL